MNNGGKSYKEKEKCKPSKSNFNMIRILPQPTTSTYFSLPFRVLLSHSLFIVYIHTLSLTHSHSLFTTATGEFLLSFHLNSIQNMPSPQIDFDSSSLVLLAFRMLSSFNFSYPTLTCIGCQ